MYKERSLLFKLIVWPIVFIYVAILSIVQLILCIPLALVLFVMALFSGTK